MILTAWIYCIVFLLLGTMKVSPLTTVPVSTCTTTSYMRGQAVSSWNTNKATIPDRISSWVSSLGYPKHGWMLQTGQYHLVTRQLVPGGLSWRWWGSKKVHGFLYGEVDQFGDFSGENICYVYPDFQTALRGIFVNGDLHNATAVNIVGERCNSGVKELRFEEPENKADVVWENTGDVLFQYGKHPKVMDPHEKKSVFVNKSTNPRAEEGLFAKRKFHRGDLVSYYGGEKLFLEDIISSNMTTEELSTSLMYTLALGESAEEMLVDVTGKHRAVEEYRTTLGHKANHKFERHNVEYQRGFYHPALGTVAGLVAVADIDPGEEIFANYNYNLQLAAPWYRQEHDHLYGKCYQHQDSHQQDNLVMGSNDFCF